MVVNPQSIELRGIVRSTFQGLQNGEVTPHTVEEKERLLDEGDDTSPASDGFNDHYENDNEKPSTASRGQSDGFDLAPASESNSTFQRRGKRTPLPYFQFSIILFLQLAEPLTSQVIYPFVPQLVRDLGVTGGNESQVGYYAGLVESLFFLTQACTVLQWSRASDRVGRKPIIMIGLLGLSLSMFSFGLSRTFWGVVFSRCLNGALNGNVGVMKSMVVEMTDSTNISQAYAFLPIAWSTGATLGPIIGGSLSQPTEQFPNLFGKNEFLKKYPYFLPCAVSATYSLLAFFVAFSYLKETLASPPSSLSRIFGFRKRKINRSLGGEHGQDMPGSNKPISLSQLCTTRVIIAASNYACLGLVDISFRAIQPLFFSTPVELGGLGLPPSTIGSILSAFGVLNGIFQMFFFARIHDRLGSKTVFVIGLSSALFLFVTFPVINYIARKEGLSSIVWIAIGVQVLVSVLISMSYGAVFIFIAAAAPNRGSIGATNGLSQLTVSLMRALGPTATNSLFSLSIEKDLLGGYLVYYVLLALVSFSLIVSSTLPRQIST